MVVRSEDYLALMYRLSELGVEARLSVIAEELRVSPPSALRELSRLERRGLVAKQKPVYLLTERGLEVAEEVVASHRILERFLTDVLHASPLKAHEVAHQIEHVRELAEMADAHLGGPATCPHGNPVPGRASVRAVPLIEAGVGVHRLARIGELGSTLKWAELLELRPGQRIEVLELTKSRVAVVLPSGAFTIPVSVARFLYVEGG